MCGISGFYDASGNPELLETMLQTMTHRGPDYGGAYHNSPLGFAHNRLYIIDLDKRSHQPFHYLHISIILNGEIYNYIELKKELEAAGFHFSTSSDTEVAAAAYLAWGEHCVDHFIGMWAFAIWDTKAQRLVCSRDRFGIKPLYYIHSGNRLFFASEYKPLKKCPLFTPDLNINQIARGLQLGWSFFEEETYFNCIKRLPAAHNLTFDGKQLNIYSYWDINTAAKTTLSKQERFEQFRLLFTDSVRLQMRSDVKVGSCLSGGLDSSAIVSAASTLFPDLPLDTFTIYYDGEKEVDERPWVEQVLIQYPNLRPHTYKPHEDELSEAFELVNYHADVPLAGSSYLSQYFVMKLASQNQVKVLLDGQGSDEYLGGYLHSFDRLIGNMLSGGRFLAAAISLQQHAKKHELSIQQALYTASKSLISAFSSENKFYQFAYKHQFPQLIHLKEKEVPFILRHQKGQSRFDEFLYHLVFSSSLPALLHFEDRNSMAFSIESRVPFLDHRLVEFSFSLPDEDKIFKGETKHILRHSLRGILPDAISNRQDKKGFVTPGEEKWLRGPLKHLLEMNFRDYEFIDNNLVLNILSDYKNGKPNSKIVWRLAALHFWLKRI